MTFYSTQPERPRSSAFQQRTLLSILALFGSLCCAPLTHSAADSDSIESSPMDIKDLGDIRFHRKFRVLIPSTVNPVTAQVQSEFKELLEKFFSG